MQDLGTWKPDGGDQRECGLRTVPSNIVGGEDTKMGEFPYMALLGFETQGDVFYTCGGSVINKWYILTAAHCTHTFPV
jgi:secreted trypsin-like serine protease